MGGNCLKTRVAKKRNGEGGGVFEGVEGSDTPMHTMNLAITLIVILIY